MFNRAIILNVMFNHIRIIANVWLNVNSLCDEMFSIIKEVLNYCTYNADLKGLIKGFMVESYIEDGNQKPDGGMYGKSITDACLGWPKTERLILDMADAL